MAINFPFEMFMQAQDRKNQNAKQMNQDIAGLGQGLGQAAGSIGQMVQEHKKKQVLNQLLAAMSQQGAPQQGPQMSGVGPLPQGTQGPTIPPTSGMGAPGQDNTALMKSLITQYNPDYAIKAQADQLFQPGLNPLQQSEAAKNNAMAHYYETGKGSVEDTVDVFYNPSMKEVSPVQTPGSVPFKVKRGSLGSLLTKPPKPPTINPVQAAALDVKVQQDNSQNVPFLKRIFGGGAPPIINPLNPKKKTGELTPQEQAEYDQLKAKYGN